MICRPVSTEFLFITAHWAAEADLEHFISGCELFVSNLLRSDLLDKFHTHDVLYVDQIS